MFEDGVAAYQHIDYATALNFLQPLAEQGDVNAQCNLGLMYFNGEGVPQDFTEAEKWWCMAAEQGHAEAQFNLGVMYANGLGVTQDFAEAVKWYRKAAEQGDTDAQDKLGVVKDWRTDRVLRKLEALLIVADDQHSLLLSGTGDLIESDDGLLSVGSGGPMALAAGRALMRHADLGAASIAEEALRIASEIDVYTNDRIIVEEIDSSDGPEV